MCSESVQDHTYRSIILTASRRRPHISESIPRYDFARLGFTNSDRDPTKKQGRFFSNTCSVMRASAREFSHLFGKQYDVRIAVRSFSINDASLRTIEWNIRRL